MPEKFVVPQFLDIEPKILGPITARQFLIMLADAGFVFVLFRLLTIPFFLLFGLPALALGIVFSFVKINGQPFHYFVINMVQTLKRPQLAVWYKEYTEGELRALAKEAVEAKAAPPPPRRELPTASKLAELSLVVNTGGAYRPE